MSASRQEQNALIPTTCVVDWLRRLVTTGVSTTVAHTHTVEEEFTAILVQESLRCTYNGVNLAANLDVRVNSRVKIGK